MLEDIFELIFLDILLSKKNSKWSIGVFTFILVGLVILAFALKENLGAFAFLIPGGFLLLGIGVFTVRLIKK